MFQPTQPQQPQQHQGIRETIRREIAAHGVYRGVFQQRQELSLVEFAKREGLEILKQAGNGGELQVMFRKPSGFGTPGTPPNKGPGIPSTREAEDDKMDTSPE